MTNYPHVGVKNTRRSTPAHRVRAEKALGRPLPKGAQVHHVDGTTSTDSALVICQDQAYHQLLHIRTRTVKAGGNPDTERVCYSCNRVLPLENFCLASARRYGRNNTCRQCKSAYDSNRNLVKKKKSQAMKTLQIVALALSFAAGACSSPTGPTRPVPADPIPVPPVVVALEPVPVPVLDPVPAPAPVPVPTPAPVPAPEWSVRYTGQTGMAQWFGPAVFAPVFTCIRYRDRIVLGSLTLPIVLQDARGFTAKASGGSFSVVDSVWIFNGLAGQAYGTLQVAQ